MASISNHSLAVFLVDDRVRCVSVAYDVVDNYGKKEARDIKSFKTFDDSIKVDDLVVIPTDTRWGFTVGKVTAIDVRVNYASNEVMRWVVNKVDKPTYDELLKQEEKLLGNVAKAQEKSAREALAAELKALNPDMQGLTMIGHTTPAQRDGGPEPVSRGGAQRNTDMEER